jgi:DNA modification methylase
MKRVGSIPTLALQTKLIGGFRLTIREIEFNWIDDMPGNFGEPTISILDRRSQRWQVRKKYWKNQGIASQLGRDDNLIYRPALEKDAAISKKIRAIGNGTSVFDPALAECLIEWFSKENDTIFDPFAGGSVRGLIASAKSRNYLGIDLSQTQISENQKQLNLAKPGFEPIWKQGDSCNLHLIVPECFRTDFILSCPPYFNLEKYTKDKNDLSNMDWDSFIDSYNKIIKASVSLLNDNRFIAWVVGDIRDKEGFLLPFIPQTIQAFENSGAKLYNHAITADIIGSGAMVMKERFHKSRKIVTKHQHCLIFVKGNPTEAAKYLNGITNE